MKAIKMYGIMVIYNKCLTDSLAYKCLMERNVNLVICDNSTKECGNEGIATKDGKAYLSMGGNLGLSYAYNRGIEYIFEKYQPEDVDWICLFDDDTHISEEYFSALENGMGEIILPIVKDAAGIMSPVKMKGRIATRFLSVEEAAKTAGVEISGINSAMAVRARIFRDYRYNEQMFLDYIDHMFIIDMRKRNIYPNVIPIEIHQNFSAMEYSKESEINRFRIQKKDLKIFYKGNPLLYYYIVIKKHLKLVKKYKDIKMLLC